MSQDNGEQISPSAETTTGAAAAEQKLKDRWQKELEIKTVSRDLVKSLAEKISVQARILNKAEAKPVDWETWSVADLEPRSPMRLGDLKAEFGDLITVLETPSGDTELSRDHIDDNTQIRAFGYWRNPGGLYAGIRFTLANEDDPPRTIRYVSLEAGDQLNREWHNVGWVRDYQSYTRIDGVDGPSAQRFISAMRQTEQLADKVITGQDFNANYTSHTEKVGKAYWEK